MLSGSLDKLEPSEVPSNQCFCVSDFSQWRSRALFSSADPCPFMLAKDLTLQSESCETSVWKIFQKIGLKTFFLLLTHSAMVCNWKLLKEKLSQTSDFTKNQKQTQDFFLSCKPPSLEKIHALSHTGLQSHSHSGQYQFPEWSYILRAATVATVLNFTRSVCIPGRQTQIHRRCACARAQAEIPLRARGSLNVKEIIDCMPGFARTRL